MSLGFEQAGFDVVAAVDVDPIHIATHRRNFPRCKSIIADLCTLSGDDLRRYAELGKRDIHVIFGGPPCGGFSIIGKRRIDDPRNQLLGHFARLVDELRPRYFVVENVEGLLLEPMTEILDEFLTRVQGAEYETVSPIQRLDASDFGVPQRRKRVFILGYRKRMPVPEYPPLPHSSEAGGAPPSPTVWDAISDLPSVDEFQSLLASDVYWGALGPTNSRYARILRGEIRDPEDLSHPREVNADGLTGCRRTKHKARTVRRFERTRPGRSEPVSRFYRLTRDGLCQTLRAGTGKTRGSFSAPRPIHPVHPRCITVREGARLHSYPDWFDFDKTNWHGFRQVGLSVPPLLGRAVGKAIHTAIESLLTGDDDD